MPQATADPVADLLTKSPLTQSDKAKVYDLYQQATSQDDLATKLQAVGIPKSVKADLWDLKGGAPAAPTAAPKWYQPGGDVLLDNIRKGVKIATNPEVVGGIAAAALTDGASIPASMAIPAAAAGVASVGRDLVSGDKTKTQMAVDAAGHAALNAAPGFLGWAGDMLAKSGAKALPILSHIAGVPGSVMRLASGAMKLADMGSASAPSVAPAVTAAADDAGGSFLHYLTGTAMVDATPAERMLLAKQRAELAGLAANKAAALAAEATARTHALAVQAAKSAAARIAVIHKAILAGHAALAAGSVTADNEGQNP